MVTISEGFQVRNREQKEEIPKKKNNFLRNFLKFTFLELEEPKPRGVKIEVLNQYSKLLADKHPDVVPMILKGVGVDVEAKDPRIGLSAYLNLNCILEYGVAQKDELIQFWTRVLDPDNVFLVRKDQVIKFFDNLSKGRFSRSNQEIFR
jgi:hypothetical protein